MADPGREGMFFVANALFCAIIVSLNEGFEDVMVLFERPNPGRGAGSDLFGEFGLLGSFCNNVWAVESSPSIILYNN
ncbi:hypothetical protein PC116_g31603 [Phytophthora cactorum]|nr:hypothetical protein PC116_g31603 [Phytophthora cactorum]